jgi:hypothetical protein
MGKVISAFPNLTMPTSNTVAQTFKLPGAAQGASSTSEFAFNDSTGTAASITLPAGWALNNRKFKLKAGGKVTGGTTTNFTAILYSGALAANKPIITSGAKAVNSVSGNWSLEAEIYTDATSQKVDGIGKGQINGTAVAQIATTELTSWVNTVDNTFSVSGTFSASNANNAATLEFLEIDLI